MTIKKKFLSFLLTVLAIQIVLAGLAWFFFNSYTEQRLKNNIEEKFISIDPALSETITFHHALKDYSTRDLIAYQLLEKHKISSFSFSETAPISECQKLSQGIICYNEIQKSIDSYIPLEIGTDKYGFLKVSKNYNESLGTGKDLIVVLVTLVLSSFFYLLMIYHLWFKVLKSEVDKVLGVLEKREIDKNVKYFEFNQIQNIIVTSFRKNEEGDKAKKELEINRMKTKIVNQVIHDIRSPLTSLDYFIDSISNKLTLDERSILMKGLERIEDILSSLNDEENLSGNELTPSLVETIVNDIVGEKRIEFRSNEVSIEVENNLPYGAFCNIHRGKISRCLSNIINNSIEEQYPARKLNLNIELKIVDSYVQINLNDNGKGIAEERLERVFIAGETFGKANGKGLGLSYAKEVVEMHKGIISLNSKVGIGTTVEILLPLISSPDWFCRKINLNSKVIVVDDDYSMHVFWKERLQSYNVECVSFTDPNDLEEYLLDSSNKDNVSFLIDYEFSKNTQTGLDIIKKFNIRKDAYLVTSHFEDNDVQVIASRIGVSIIPKLFLKKIPIEKSKNTPELVLIDDDKFIHLSWKMASEKIGVKVHSFYNIEDFLQTSSKILKETPIFLDNYFKGESLGVDYSKAIFDAGFFNILLISEDRSLETPAWIKERASKRFPYT